MKRGTPLMQAIPFRRESWQSAVQECNPQMREEARGTFQSNLHLYKDEHWKKKTYG
jgi:hypothetical protein